MYIHTLRHNTVNDTIQIKHSVQVDQQASIDVVY